MTQVLWFALFAALFSGLVLIVFMPGCGLLPRLRRLRSDSVRIICEDALKHILNCASEGVQPTLDSLAGALHVKVDKAAGLLGIMEGRGLVELDGERIGLTQNGRDYAVHILRAHRLWELYLADETGYADREWHAKAEQHEHWLTPAEAEVLSLQLGNPMQDPHGHPIPSATGELAVEADKPLSALKSGESAQIFRIKDHPKSVFKLVKQAGLRPGMRVKMLEKAGGALRIRLEDRERVIPSIIAAGTTVVDLPERLAMDKDIIVLSKLLPGQEADVVTLSLTCRGVERRRMLDLGFVSGSKIQAEFISPGGDPTAYRVKDSLIALRREQADQVYIENVREAA